MMRRAAVALVCVAAVPAVAVTTAPRIRVAASGDVSIVLPESILRNDEVRKQLTSGLTTSFVITTSDRDRNGATLRGAARVDVRYDLWDETFVVEVVHASGAQPALTIASFEKLAEWWRTAATPFVRCPREAAPESLRVKVDVLPFSAREETSAQKWLSKSLDPAASASGHTRRDDPRSSASEIIDAIIATSIRRRPILSFRWTARVETEPAR